jgi:hypothetical protein
MRKTASGPAEASCAASASIIVSTGTRLQWPPVYGLLSSIAVLMSSISDSKSISSCWMRSRFVSAIAAWEASDSASRWSSSSKAVTPPVSGSLELRSCSTPMISPSWFFIGTVRNEVER